MATLQAREQVVTPAAGARPAFLITIDTEGDDLWSNPREITTANARYLPRFQALCERHGLKPTWLTNYEMARDPAFVELARDAQRRGVAEVGMHLHAWNSPPLVPLTDNDMRHHPYLVEYPEPVLREKVRVMTDLLGETFGAPVSHRAGRWALSPTYARVLVAEGYRVDCSVTPGVSWRDSVGDPAGRGGSDYTDYPERAYFLDLDDLARPGRSPLLEVPMTIRTRRHALRPFVPPVLLGTRLVRSALARLTPIRWLRPRGGDRPALLRLLGDAVTERRDYVEFMLHSSELMPGGSPTFGTARDIEALYEDLEALFAAAAGRFVGLTLAEYHDHFRAACRV
jgi:hypothetical protein